MPVALAFPLGPVRAGARFSFEPFASACEVSASSILGGAGGSSSGPPCASTTSPRGVVASTHPIRVSAAQQHLPAPAEGFRRAATARRRSSGASGLRRIAAPAVRRHSAPELGVAAAAPPLDAQARAPAAAAQQPRAARGLVTLDMLAEPAAAAGVGLAWRRFVRLQIRAGLTQARRGAHGCLGGRTARFLLHAHLAATAARPHTSSRAYHGARVR